MSSQFYDVIIDEPVKEFTHKGYPCAMIFGPYTLNGYIRVPKGHPWHNKGVFHKTLRDVDVHGGVTLAMNGVIGFDTNHCDDAWHPKAPKAKRDKENFQYGIYWDAKSVEAEVRKLAEQAWKAEHA